MAARIANTLQEKFGFMDTDLEKPEHDEIINWIDDNVEDLLMIVLNWPKRPNDARREWESIVNRTEEGHGFLGFVDLVASTWDRKVIFEAKTKIDSLGVLFRQIRLYREGYLDGKSVYKIPIVVVCPDDKHALRIREQGIHFLKYDPKMKFAMGGV